MKRAAVFASLLCVCVAAGSVPALAQSESASVLSPGVKQDTTLVEKDLASLTRRIAKRQGLKTTGAFTASVPTRAVTRISLLAALVRASLTKETLLQYKAEMPEQLPPDFDSIPEGERVYIAAAVGEGWLTVDKPFRRKQVATWGYADLIAAKITPADKSRPTTRHARSEEALSPAPKLVEEASVSGLIIETGDLNPERAMSPRILDEDGKVVYPEEGHCPDPDYVLEYGMLDYCKETATTKRSGSRPLTVTALKLGPHRSDVVVSNADAERIRETNKKLKFLWRWAVCFVPGLSATVETMAIAKKTDSDN